MRVKSVTERYRAVNEGTMSKKEFVRQMRQQYPMHITQFNGFDDSVQILRNRGLLFETKTEVVEEAKVYDDRPALTYSLDALDRGIRVELATMGVEPGQQSIKGDDLKKATKKAKDNLEKNATHYLDLMSGESKKVDKQDKMKETKRGAKDTDVMNGLKKATLKEGYTEEQIEAAIQRIKERKTPIGEVEKSEEEKEIQGFKDKALVDAGVSLTGTGASTHEIVFDHRGTTQTIAFRDSEEAAEQAKAKLEDTGYFGDKNLRVVPAGMKEDSVDEKEEDHINPGNTPEQDKDREDYLSNVGMPPHMRKDVVKEAGKTALIQTMNNAISAIKGKYGEMPGIAGIIRDFLKTHIDDLANGADPLDEFENYVDANYDSLSETEGVDELAGTESVDALTAIIGAGGLAGGAVALSKLIDSLEDGKFGDRGKAVAKFLRDAGKTFSGQGAPMKEGEIKEYKAAFDSLIEAIKELNTDGDEISAAADAMEFIGQHYGIPFEFESIMPSRSDLEEKKGKDHDGDGDIDGDDYKAAKDKAIKNAMGKDEQIKEAVKSIIKKVLTENTLNEAATGNLSKFSDDYADFEGMTQIINQLENLVTEVEGFYAKTGEKLQKIFDSIGNVTNEEGLKVGGFIAPAIESAFKKDIQPVVKKGFMNSVKIPTIKQITQGEIDQFNAQGMAEEEMEEKQTMFTPVMEAINKDLQSFGKEIAQNLEKSGHSVKLLRGKPDDEVTAAIGGNSKLAALALNQYGESLEIYVNPDKKSVLNDLIKKYNLTMNTTNTKTVGWDDKKVNRLNKGDLFISMGNTEIVRWGETYMTRISRFNPDSKYN